MDTGTGTPMKISWNWLRELVKLPASLSSRPRCWKRLAKSRRLIRRGVAVDALIPVGVGLSVAPSSPRSAASDRIRKADKLTLVDVFDCRHAGRLRRPNVCPAGQPDSRRASSGPGPARRCRTALRSACAILRGIPSPGMLCAEDDWGCLAITAASSFAPRRRAGNRQRLCAGRWPT